MQKLFLYTLILILLCTFRLSADDFGRPWNSSIKTGDELLAQKHRHNFAPLPIYNGVQGGAYFLIRFYQLAISPQDGPACRFSPTCSAYGKQAVQKFGAFIGALMAGDRILRCNPYNPPGRDPLPNKLINE